MYDDYLKGVDYEEEVLTLDYFPVAEKVLKQKKKQKKKRKHPKAKLKSASNAILQNRSNIKELQTQLKTIGGVSDNISKNSSSILKGMENILGITLIVGVALLGLKKYLDSKQSYNAKYAPTGTTYEENATVKSSGKTSEEGKRRIIEDEGGVRLESYKDSKGVWTIGAGHTGQVRGKALGPGVKITYEEGMKLLEQDLKKAESIVNRDVKVPLTQRWFDALVNFTFINGHLRGTKLLNAVNKQDWRTAQKELSIESIHEPRMKKWRTYVEQDIDKTGKIKQEAKTVKPFLVGTSAGKRHKYANNTEIAGYRMWNPSPERKFIELSERAETYLRETGGRGIVTSGAEGEHAFGEISHKSGNKIDVQGFRGKDTTNKEYAELCINFLKNPNTAFINLETFRIEDVRQIVEYIKQMDSTAYQLAQKATPYLPGKEKAIIYGKGKLLTSLWNPNHSRHLDIGILPNAYSKNQAKQEQKINEKAANTEKIKKNNADLKNTNKKSNKKVNKNSKTNTTQNPIIVNQSKNQQQKIPSNNMGGTSLKNKVQNDKDNRKKATKY